MDVGDRLRSDLEASDEEVATLREMCKKQLGQLEVCVCSLQMSVVCGEALCTVCVYV